MGRDFVLHQLDGAGHHLVDVDGPKVLFHRPCVVEELAHHAIQAVDLLDNDLEKLRILAGALARAEALGGAFDGSQWVADFMR